MNNAQLELGFAATARCQAMGRPQRRLSRAHWWFERMRRIVERASDWDVAPPPRPEQIWFAGAHRQVQTSPDAQQHPSCTERQVAA